LKKEKGKTKMERRGKKQRNRKRGKKNIWKDKNNFECMLFNIELLVQVLRL
jgi:hypothetical protein